MSAEDDAPLVTAGEKLDDDFRTWRDARLADPAFRRWAAASPLTRPLATRSARKLFDLTAGFVYSQILKACVDLDLFGKLAQGPKTVAEVAAATGLPPAGALRLLDAATALELVELRRDCRYGLGVLGAALNGEPGVKAMIAHHDRLYADLADPVALLKGGRGGELSKFWPYAGQGGAPAASQESAGEGEPRAVGEGEPRAAGEGEPRATGEGFGDAEVAGYSELMDVSQSFVADDVLDVFQFGDRNALLDVGGGQGAFVEAAARRWPELRLALLDLAPVAARAEARLAAAGLSGRVAVHRGDMFSDPWPTGFDVVSLVRVLHDHDDSGVAAILARAHAALAPQGELMIAEPIAGMPGAKRVGPYFGFYLLAMGSGRPRSADELSNLLRTAGFWNVRTRFTRGALPLAVITAKRAGEGPVWRN